MNEEFDLVAIGDITTDTFIRIKQASVYYNNEDEEEKICLTNGGKIPYEFTKVIPGVGNSSNAAVSATRLGLKTALVTDLGDDENGEDILEALKKNDIDSRFVHVHAGKTSNHHYLLWHKAERTILVKHENYDYVLPNIGNPRWIYFSSVAENSLEYHQEIVQFMQTHPETKLAFQPGTFQVKLGYETLKEVYKISEVFFCNKEESRMILKTKEKNCAKLAHEISLLGPKIAVVTDARNGAFVYDGEKAWSIPIYPDQEPPLESTGAGDSFSSAFTSALALGKSVEEALMWGPINSMSVIRHVGAQEGLLTREELEKYLAEKPENYMAQKVDI